MGGSFAPVPVAAFTWNGWQDSAEYARTAEASGADLATIPLAPLKKEDAPNKELEEAWEYYHTDRCMCSTAPGYTLARSLNQIITYDAYHKAEAS